jgi:hypothetical protein
LSDFLRNELVHPQGGTMVHLTIRQVRIFNTIWQNGPVSQKELLKTAGVSLRTLLNEIRTINEELVQAEIPCAIRADYNRGYEITGKDQPPAAEFERVCICYLNQTATFYGEDNPRLPTLIRRLLSEPDYVRSETLMHELAISGATLTSDLTQARKILAEYDLKLVSLPYHGMRVEGPPIAIRCCKVDFFDYCDIYSVPQFFPVEAFRSFHVDPQAGPPLRRELARCLAQGGLRLKASHFRILFLSLLISRFSGSPEFAGSSTDPLSDKEAVNALADTILKQFALPAEDRRFVELVLLTGSESLPAVDAETSQAVGDVLNRIYNQCHLDLGKKPQLSILIATSLYQFFLAARNHFHFANEAFSNWEIAEKLPATESLALQILENVRQSYGCEYTAEDVLQLTLPLFNAIFLIPNEYHLVRAAYIGPFSAETTRSVSRRLNLAPRHNVHLDHYSLNEVDAIDLDAYDAIFLAALPGYQLPPCRAQVIPIDFFYKTNTEAFYNKVLARHRIENFLLYKTDNKVELTIPGVDPPAEIAASLQECGLTNPYCAAIVRFLIRQNEWVHGHERLVVCLLNQRELEHTLYIYHLEQPLKARRMALREIQVVVMDPNDNVLAVKQADSYVRRMQQRAGD